MTGHRTEGQRNQRDNKQQQATGKKIHPRQGNDMMTILLWRLLLLVHDDDDGGGFLDEMGRQGGSLEG